MNADSCQTIAELLVDFADGALARDETERVRTHIEHCPDCQAMVEALRQSLQGAGMIWQDNLRDTQAVHVHRRRLRQYVAAAATILLALAAALFWSGRREPVAKPPTLAEMEHRIVVAGVAARLLAATDQLETQASLQDVAKSQYQYILAKYPETEAALQARLRLKNPR